MTTLSRPLLSLLESTFEAPTGSTHADIVRLRESLTVALRRCLDAPDATWVELVNRGTAAGEWDEWRVAGLLAAADADPDVTREALATLTDELLGRRDVIPGPWEGADRQAAVDTPEWHAGRMRREIVFAIERAMVCASNGDVDGLCDAADRILDRNGDGSSYTDLPAALRACATDLDEHGTVTPLSRDALSRSLAGTPFAASVDRLGV